MFDLPRRLSNGPLVKHLTEMIDARLDARLHVVSAHREEEEEDLSDEDALDMLTGVGRQPFSSTLTRRTSGKKLPQTAS